MTPAQTDSSAPEVEHRYHHYTGNQIPWYVRVLWLLFWIFLIYYSVRYLFPAVQTELVTPP